MGTEELELVKEAFASNYIAPLGPMVDALEEEFAAYTGIPHCLALCSGTAAIHLALRHLGIGAGDRVVASTLTFIGSISPITCEGAEPVFIDCDRQTWNMDPRLLEEELEESAATGRLPKAVIPTDIYGQCCDLPRIRAVCDAFDVPVVCDSAEAAGARYRASGIDAGEPEGAAWRHAGFDAWAAVYSFNGNKIITTGGGGMLASHDRELIDHARKLATQARDPAAHYEHSEIGFNYRMSNVLAAIGRGQLRLLDQRVDRRREIFAAYRARLQDLPGIAFMPEAPSGRSTRWLTVVLISSAEFGAPPEDIRLALEAENIEARPLWKPMHLQPVFRGRRVRGGAISEDLFARGLCLPSGTAMEDTDVDRVCDVFRRCRSS